MVTIQSTDEIDFAPAPADFFRNTEYIPLSNGKELQLMYGIGVLGDIAGVDASEEQIDQAVSVLANEVERISSTEENGTLFNFHADTYAEWIKKGYLHLARIGEENAAFMFTLPAGRKNSWQIITTFYVYPGYRASAVDREEKGLGDVDLGSTLWEKVLAQYPESNLFFETTNVKGMSKYADNFGFKEASLASPAIIPLLKTTLGQMGADFREYRQGYTNGSTKEYKMFARMASSNGSQN